MPSEPHFTQRARAKVNLTLHVGRVIADRGGAYYGYHPLDSLVVFADVGDEIRAEPAEKTQLTIVGPFTKGLSAEADNLILKAIAAVSARASVPPFNVVLTKNLPVASGLGGGSANAAAMLRILQNYTDLAVSDWREIALSLGADVPVCLLSQTAHMTGIGEAVTPIKDLGQWPAVLVAATAKTVWGYARANA